MVKKYIVTLTEEERQYLEQFTSTGKHAAYQINHARILLKADRNQPNGSWHDEDIKAAFEMSIRTIEQVRQRCVEEGIEAALKCRPGAGRKRKLDGDVEAHLCAFGGAKPYALRCSDAPTCRGRWTLRLLAERMVELNYVDQISHESVRQVLKKTNCNPGSRSAG